MEWHTTTHDDLPAAIAEFKAALPGWWYSVCECQVSCDATIAPTTESPDIALVKYNSPFDVGFDVALEQPSSLAEALRFVVAEALAAKAALQTAPTPADGPTGSYPGRLLEEEDTLRALEQKGETK